MCGIAGIVGARSLDHEKQLMRLKAMQQALVHRGPDGCGVWTSPTHHVGLAHTRLAIIDLSQDGRQPMSTKDGRYTIVFNGEVYNYAELRDELHKSGVAFRSGTDTEVILRLYERDGRACLDRLNGMFAFAIWDRERQSCFLARDPLGVKPLYLWRQGNQIAFASEIRALLKSELGVRRLCTRGLAGYLLHGSVQEPDTLIDGVCMLPAGHWMVWKDGSVQTSSYANVQFSAEPMDAEHATFVTRNALRESVRRHFVSDVPVGIFLSGGIDSTALVALAKVNGRSQLETFCIGFDESEFDESELAARTAKHFGTRHYCHRMNAREGRGFLNGYLDSIDQPSNDGFNTFCVSKFAHAAGLKVVLSGLGGDELFGGYPSFDRVPQLMKWGSRIVRYGAVKHGLSRFERLSSASTRLRRLAAFCGTSGRAYPAYWAMRGFFTPNEASRLVQAYVGDHDDVRPFDLLEKSIPRQPCDRDIVSYLELTHYMRNQLLRDSDVMSMAHGLELRVPFVDRTLLQSIARIPSAIRHAAGKQLALDSVPEIPKWIAKQPKKGFRFPFDRWMTKQWGAVFQEIDDWAPVRLGQWHRRWALLTLHHFFRTNRVQGVEHLPS